MTLRQGYNALLEKIGVPKGMFSIQFSENEHSLVIALLCFTR